MTRLKTTFSCYYLLLCNSDWMRIYSKVGKHHPTSPDPATVSIINKGGYRAGHMLNMVKRVQL